MANATATADRSEAMRGVRGKNVLVTGGSSGIGQAIAVAATMNGSDVACMSPAMAACRASSAPR